jgi:hypothetical protein
MLTCIKHRYFLHAQYKICLVPSLGIRLVGVRGVHVQVAEIHYIKNFLFYATLLNMALHELTSSRLVLVRSGPFCPHVRSILTFSSPRSTRAPQFKYWSSWL